MDKGIYKVVKGDATIPQAEKFEAAIIPHVCNDLGGWGKGFVLALNKRFGDLPLRTYRIDCQGKKRLGRTSTAVVNETEKHYTVVANMIAQRGYIDEENNPRPLRYDALVQCMIQVAAYAKGINFFGDRPNIKKVSIHCPKFGSGLAGGNWEFIEKLIEDIWLSQGLDVTVYEFDG
jgi:O-acetyl-ADP-ribose deacetylase (regulator of RNase III)